MANLVYKKAYAEGHSYGYASIEDEFDELDSLMTNILATVFDNK